MSLPATEAHVWHTVQEINRAWTRNKDVSVLREYFHADMVAITPTDRHRLEGRDACIAGWQQFASSADVLQWEEHDPKVQLHAEGRVAVVTYEYRCVCRIAGEPLQLAGRDMLVLTFDRGRWWVVADQFSGFPGRGPA